MSSFIVLKMSLKKPTRGGSFIDYSGLIKNKKATINSINKKDNKCFWYAAAVALVHQKIIKDPQRITITKSFLGKYNKEGINYPS